MSDKPTVQEAWAAVMADVQALGKNQRNSAPGANYNFRGIDDVMNAVGPALRKHGVSVVPTTAEVSLRDVHTSTGKPSRESTVRVTYTIYGPAGDSMPGASVGEAMDSADKGSSKAMSVAFRTFLLQALCLPTDEPDPDSYHYERAEAPQETPEQAVARGIRSASTLEALQQVLAWATTNGVTPPAEFVEARRAELAAAPLAEGVPA